MMKAAILLSFLLACGAHAAQPEVVRAGILARSDFEWTMDGQNGFCPDILKALQKRDPGLSFAWALPALPEKRLLFELGSGDVDLACGLVRTPERERQYQVPDVVLFEKTLVAVVRDGDALDLNSFADLKGLGSGDVVLVNAGSQVSERLHRLANFKIDDGGASSAVNLQKLMLGRGRVFLYDDPAIDWEVRRTHYGKHVHAIAAALDVDRYYMMLSPRLPPYIVKRIAIGLAHLRDDGTLRELVERWSTRVELGKAGTPGADGFSG